VARLNRRAFVGGALAAGAAAATLSASPVFAATPGTVGTLIDLTLCDGCPDRETPACVAACRAKNAERFPGVDKSKIKPYWPQARFEDWSDQQDRTDRLTPYNWTYVQKVSVEHQGAQQDVFVPRRCMHCDNPPCANVCPFGAQTKTDEGPVVINPDLCFGGAKCRDVCPWGIPQRQAGVGLYLKVAPDYAGGGVMYKCDLCIDRIRQGEAPACVDACPRGAVLYGERKAIRAEAHRRAREIGGHIYGEDENGGTSTLYVSAVPFESIHRAMLTQAVDGKPGRPAMPPARGNFTDTVNGLAGALLATPVVGLMAAGALAFSARGRRRHLQLPVIPRAQEAGQAELSSTAALTSDAEMAEREVPARVAHPPREDAPAPSAQAPEEVSR
jgi:Fe-S-cluster-containing dehydrogenase component